MDLKTCLFPPQLRVSDSELDLWECPLYFPARDQHLVSIHIAPWELFVSGSTTPNPPAPFVPSQKTPLSPQVIAL